MEPDETNRLIGGFVDASTALEFVSQLPEWKSSRRRRVVLKKVITRTRKPNFLASLEHALQQVSIDCHRLFGYEAVLVQMPTLLDFLQLE